MITILSEETINKIAAGEVIERPVNAVKELVENSLDAGAKSIEIEIKDAGKKLIRVKDDGIGMDRDELLLAVKRHATSKISLFEDLSKLNTMGFRGEALPSIAAVSNLLIQSQPKKGPKEGWETELTAGKTIESRSWAGAGGTNVEVRDLFFNTPARKKFLKSDTTEKNQIVRTIEEIALSRPDVSFSLISDGKKLLNTSASKNQLERIIDVFGADLSEKLIPVQVDHPNIRIRGYISPSQYSFPNRNFQYLFVNRRPVAMTKSLANGVFESYRESLQSGRYPAVIIFLELEPGEIDVNVHPTKREVRFSKEQEIRQLLYVAIKNAITNAGASSFFPSTAMHEQTHKSAQTEVSKKEEYRPIYSSRSSAGEVNETKKIYGRQNEFESGFYKGSGPRVLGQINNLYIVCQHDGCMYIVDQHAAQERIRYEQYIDEWNKRKIAVQPMLIPVTIELSASQSSLLKENIGVLKEIGIEIEDFGPKTLRLSALPAVLGNKSEINDLLDKITEAMIEGTKLPQSEKTEKIIRAACHSSVKAGDALSLSEMMMLINSLFKCRMPYSCPHGRPTSFKVTFRELEKYFKRV